MRTVSCLPELKGFHCSCCPSNVEQFYRDNRLNPIHEGTHGIQALDLLGRKVVMKQGAALRLLAGEISATVNNAKAHPELVT